MPKNRKRYLTTDDIARLHNEDTANELKLNKIAENAVNEDKLEPYRKAFHNAQVSVVETKTSLLNATDMEIRAKLDRIGYNSRLTPADLVERKELTRPEQAEIDAYQNKLRQFGAQANLIDETQPFIEPLPQNEQDWIDLGPDYDFKKLIKNNTEIKRLIINRSNTIIKEQKKSRRSRALENAETDLERFNAQYETNDIRIKQIEENRRLYIAQINAQNKPLVEEYTERVQALTTLGLSTKRLPMESDEDYVTRINDNINAMTLEEQLFDGEIYLMREFLAKMRTLNVPLDVIESLNKHIPDDVKNWVLSAWPLVKKEFIKMYGTNPYRINTEYAYDFIMKMHESRDVSAVPQAIRVTTNNIQKVNYLMNKFKTKMESIGVPSKIVKLLNDGLPDEVKEWITSNFHIVQQALVRMYGRTFVKMTAEGAYDDIMDLYNNKPTDYGDEENAEHQVDEDAFMFGRHEAKAGDDLGVVQEGEGFRKLGKKQIHMGKLLKSNKLDVRNDKKGNIYGFPVASVSDQFVSHVNNLVHGKGISNDDISQFNNNEQKLYQRLQHVCELKGGYHDSDSLGSMKNRLKLVEDEIRSGNDNKHLLVEAKEILTVLARQNVITKGEKDRFYKQLCNVND